ncbi:universal stress protein [Mariniblastus fucicola]|uniref:Universal stress protein UspE n=1 Tax=Mariniblastus fucicola TaxID=980251 RepID=A0A5B9P2N4_9BACT|nr:universal stress protein [Mariniblastus fucicola]QEG20404.1 universal stress protein UspE [Mariniblastus fucicola]
MFDTFKKIMLVTNEPCDTDGAERSAVFLAKYFGADVLLVDSLKTPFYPRHAPALSTEIAYEVALKSKAAYLETLKQRFENLGITTSTKISCSPRTSSELISTVLDEGCDLVIRYLKGNSSRAEGRFGETARNLMRACPVPVLFAQEPVEDPKVVACINLDHDDNENQSIIENARLLVDDPEHLFVVCCWEFSGSDVLFDFMDESLSEQTREEAAEMYSSMFDRMVKDLDLHAAGGRVQLLNCNPVTGIPEFCRENGIDVAVMCSASLDHPLGRKLGSTIEKTIGALPCGLVTVKPIGFESPVVERAAAEARFKLAPQS